VRGRTCVGRSGTEKSKYRLDHAVRPVNRITPSQGVNGRPANLGLIWKVVCTRARVGGSYLRGEAIDTSIGEHTYTATTTRACIAIHTPGRRLGVGAIGRRVPRAGGVDEAGGASDKEQTRGAARVLLARRGRAHAHHRRSRAPYLWAGSSRRQKRRTDQVDACTSAHRVSGPTSR
jgi:hypothetical protein